MKHYLLVGDQKEVLGVWMVDGEMSASRLKLELELKYPDCETLERDAQDYESFKSNIDESYDLDDILPIPA